MEIDVTQEAAVPPGTYNGLVVEVDETSIDYKDGKGLVPTVTLVIQPAWQQDADTTTLPVRVSYPAKLNGLSNFSGLLTRLGMTPPKGSKFSPKVLHMKEVVFTCKNNDEGFVKVDPKSVGPAPPKGTKK